MVLFCSDISPTVSQCPVVVSSLTADGNTFISSALSDSFDSGWCPPKPATPDRCLILLSPAGPHSSLGQPSTTTCCWSASIPSLTKFGSVSLRFLRRLSSSLFRIRSLTAGWSIGSEQRLCVVAALEALDKEVTKELKASLGIILKLSPLSAIVEFTCFGLNPFF